MDWNYRVFQETNGDYIIREVFYAEDGSIIGCTDDAVEPSGRSLTELARDIECFRQALALPTLTLDDIPTYRQPIESRQHQDSVQDQLLAAFGLMYPASVH
jgi:hypothetical protein